ncbi:hypothetical protein KR018_012628 [Drosophila ironensis]|nr:hypothetical protein KR018_012628 [Drosophila ironensis]
MSLTLVDLHKKSQIFWSHLVQLLMQFANMTLYWNQSKPQETVQEPQKEKAKPMHNRAQEYAKVELLHRMLVEQQLKDLKRRRMVALQLARRRLDYSN